MFGDFATLGAKLLEYHSISSAVNAVLFGSVVGPLAVGTGDRKFDSVTFFGHNTSFTTILIQMEPPVGFEPTTPSLQN